MNGEWADSCPPEEFTKREQVAVICGVIIPFLGFVTSIFIFWGWGIGLVEVILLAIGYVFTCLGISIGFHRYFTHKSFSAKRPLQICLAILGSMATEGSLFNWTAFHRLHHKHSDGAEDPHSPHNHGGGVLGTIKGLWHAHVGWIFTKPNPNKRRFIPDLLNDKVLTRINAMFPLWVTLGLLIPAGIGGAISLSFKGAVLGFLWGGLVRIFLLHHITWSVNSICHYFGARPFLTKDNSANNFIFGIIGAGEGWHNNHHAFPSSARHGFRWWQFDLSWYAIRLLTKLGFIYGVKLPSQQSIEAKTIS